MERMGVDGFRFWDKPLVMPETETPDTNVYDMRLTKHEDGWIYRLFCTERRDPTAVPGDTSSAAAQCGIARTKDLVSWERLPDLKTGSAQQRNVVLHSEFVRGKYALYTRPSEGFMQVGMAGGIDFALCGSMENAEVTEETMFYPKVYHTIVESKNGQGPTPIETPAGWLHITHGVHNCAAGLRYVLYALLTGIHEPDKVIARPGGHLMEPIGYERIGDVSNVLFCNAAVAKENGDMFIYYASSDTRSHVAATTIDKMGDYCLNTPEDGLRSYACAQQRLELIRSSNTTRRYLLTLACAGRHARRPDDAMTWTRLFAAPQRTSRPLPPKRDENPSNSLPHGKPAGIVARICRTTAIVGQKSPVTGTSPNKEGHLGKFEGFSSTFM